MPRMNGFEFMEAVSKMGRDHPSRHHGIGHEFGREHRARLPERRYRFHQKPFIRDEMVSRVKLQIENIPDEEDQLRPF